MTATSGPHPDVTPPHLVMAFAPVHKRAFGLAVGFTSGLLTFAITVFHVLAIGSGEGPNLWLLGNYFYGYTVSWQGAVVGFAWAAMAGFVGAWFVAFVRNLVMGIWIFRIRTAAELSQTADFLDHI